MVILNTELRLLLDRMNNRLVQVQSSILSMELDMASNLDRVLQAVEKTEAGTESLVRLLEGLAADVRSNITDQAVLGQIADRLENEAGVMAAAVEAHPRGPDEPPAPGA